MLKASRFRTGQFDVQFGSIALGPTAANLKYYFRFGLDAAFSSTTACAAAKREMGTRNGEALT